MHYEASIGVTPITPLPPPPVTHFLDKKKQNTKEPDTIAYTSQTQWCANKESLEEEDEHFQQGRMNIVLGSEGYEKFNHKTLW